MRGTSKVKCGDKFGRLTVVVPYVKRKRDGRKCCLVVCSCGSPMKAVEEKRLLGKDQLQSCGCWRPGALKHGHSQKPEYFVWKEAKARIFRKSHKRFSDYGGRGLTMEPDWAESFEAFWSDLGPRPSEKHTLERYDNELGYVRGNCGWETIEVQSRNKRNNRLILFQGKYMVLSDACSAAGISKARFYQRIAAGWSEEKAICTPLLR